MQSKNIFMHLFHFIQKSPVLKKTYFKLMYRLLGIGEMSLTSCLNYGYRDCSACDESDHEKNSLNLYEFIVSKHDLRATRIVEIGVGRGGGLNHLNSKYRPVESVGIDLSKRNVSLARARFNNIRFDVAGADDLCLPDDYFDYALNVESSHCYPSREKFFQEVHRVLSQNGVFLYTDFTPTDDALVARHYLDQTLRALETAGMSVIEYVDITGNVISSLRSSSNGKRNHIMQLGIPGFVKNWLCDFAATEGSQAFRLFDEGKSTYFFIRACKA